MKKQGCIIVPYRDRSEHLKEFLKHYVDVLPIYIIEQTFDKPFNRAKLLNIGFLEFGNKYDYAIYHDVDMLCESGAAYELYPEKPMHLATAASQFGYKMPYPTYFGGVTSISTKDMVVLNGFSNEFYGYGGEDDHMFNKCMRIFKSVHAVQNNRYTSLAHERHIDPVLYKNNVQLLHKLTNDEDGLSTCIYSIVKHVNGRHIIVSL
jgi:hypothetical protein